MYANKSPGLPAANESPKRGSQFGRENRPGTQRSERSLLPSRQPNGASNYSRPHREFRWCKHLFLTLFITTKTKPT